MSQPGSVGRRQITAEGDDQVVRTTAQLVGEIPGVRSFELRYDTEAGDMGDREEWREDEIIVWQAVATIRVRNALGQRDETSTVGEARTGPGHGPHGPRGWTMACVNLLETLGANTVVVEL